MTDFYIRMMTSVRLELFFICNLSLFNLIYCSVKVPKIAIVGGGIGGTSAAYFLQDLFGQDGAEIDLYEWNKIGGRLSTVKIEDYEYEVGGAIIHPRNKYMTDFRELLGLKKRNPGLSKFGLYNGNNFVFSEDSDWEFVNLVKLLWRYGYGAIKLQSSIDDMLKDFERIYPLQVEGHAFTTLPALLSAMSPDFVADLQISAKNGFKKSGFSDQIIDELVTATLTANYGQTSEVHKFVGAVSIAGASGGLWSVHGGNRLVPEGLLQLSKANLITARVLNITLQPETEKFVVQCSGGATKENSSVYDIVILATPLTKDTISGLKFVNFPKQQFSFPGEYHRTVCTVVSGALNYTYFGYDSPEEVMGEILTVSDDLLFSSLGRIYPVLYDGEGSVKPYTVWKIFTHVPLTEQEMNLLFLSQESVQVIDWLAYPHYHTKPRNDSFVLYRNLYHVNAIEWAASAMEMSAIGAKNAALLAYNNWSGKTEFIKDTIDGVSSKASRIDL